MEKTADARSLYRRDQIGGASDIAAFKFGGFIGVDHTGNMQDGVGSIA